MPTTWVARPQFLSTLSLRRATETPRRQPHSTQFLSTLSLRRATCYSLRHSTSRWYFYPRSPCGERLRDALQDLRRVPISIHALLAESDQQKCRDGKAHINFYPRSPCGERRHGVGFAKIDLAFLSTLSLRRATYGRINDISRLIFLSTLSLRRATKGQLYTSAYIQISIHALLAESDRQPAQLLYKPRMISIHALLAESDLPAR